MRMRWKVVAYFASGTKYRGFPISEQAARKLYAEFSSKKSTITTCLKRRDPEGWVTVELNEKSPVTIGD